ncbi:uncharacterized protein DS421_17g592040 [Arachis hypogaea]|nr:uncharacterized protein DS421_17g592040 [Arachis hypogaea]
MTMGEKGNQKASVVNIGLYTHSQSTTRGVAMFLWQTRSRSRLGRRPGDLLPLDPLYTGTRNPEAFVDLLGLSGTPYLLHLR